MPPYSLLDFGNGERLEQWGEFRLRRPDPTAFGLPVAPELWPTADAVYEGEKGKGEWRKHRELPESWKVQFGDLLLTARLAPYKHTGIFPEQEKNWLWARRKASECGRSLNVLNLFAYTGGATVALAKDGHHVTHVDASKPSIAWAKENAAMNEIASDKIRWILDDAPTFVGRELRRGKTYDAIILDPPAYGHGPSGKAWRVERDLAPLLEWCVQLLSPTPSFVILNGYAQHDTTDSFHRLLLGILSHRLPQKKAMIRGEELLLKAQDGRELSTGIVMRCGFPHLPRRSGHPLPEGEEKE